MLRAFHKLKVSQKLMLISVLFMIPDTVLLCLFLFSINANIQFARLETLGNEYQSPLERLLELLPAHALAKRPEAQFSLAAEIDTALAELQRVDGEIGAKLQFTPEGLSKRNRQHCTVATIRSEWDQLKHRRVENANAHLHLIEDVRTMITHAGDTSNLILDPDLDSYYLMDVTLLALPEMQDRLWNTASYGNEALEQGNLNNAQRVQLAVNAALLRVSDLDRVVRSSETALNEDRNFYGVSETLEQRLRPALAAFRTNAVEFIELTESLRDGTAVSAEEYLMAGMAAHAQSFRLWKVAKEELNTLLEKRIHYYRMRRARSLVLTACALMAAVGFVGFITHSISGPLKRQADELRHTNETLHEEIRERHRAEQALKAAEQKYRSIFENSVEGIFQTTVDGNYLVANPTLARIYGYETPADLQRSLTDISGSLYVDPGQRAEFQKQIADKGEVYRFESQIYHKSGRKLWISENARGVRDENGNLLYYEGTVEDITERKANEAALEKARQELLSATRLAGMAEVATGILHNVGNVLNSVNVSANCISESLRKSRMTNLRKAAALISENRENLARYFQEDAKGKLLPGYIVDLAEHLHSEHETLLQRMDQLKTHLEHVKEIVAMQQNFAKVGGVSEQVRVSEVLEDALRLNANGLARQQIEIVREYQTDATVLVDKHKVLQILVNLVRNAEHACGLSGNSEKRIILRVAAADERIRIAVQDNGVGIPAENMVRIFQHGFTTKKDGHGFGLHSCALTAKELGGSLKAHSEGEGRGATFTLEIPVQPTKAVSPRRTVGAAL